MGGIGRLEEKYGNIEPKGCVSTAEWMWDKPKVTYKDQAEYKGRRSKWKRKETLKESR
jgi:hypothetical protein